MPVRVVDLSLGGAAVEGAFRMAFAADMKLQIEWCGLRLTRTCTAVEWRLGEIPPTLRLAFGPPTGSESVVLKALIDSMAAEPADAVGRTNWLRRLAG